MTRESWCCGASARRRSKWDSLRICSSSTETGEEEDSSPSSSSTYLDLVNDDDDALNTQLGSKSRPNLKNGEIFELELETTPTRSKEEARGGVDFVVMGRGDDVKDSDRKGVVAYMAAL